MFPPIKVTAKITGTGFRNFGVLSSAGRRQVLRAMGREFYNVTMGTFGASGVNRAAEWPPLTKRYQKRINYFGPPKLVLRGNLRASIRVVSDNDRYVEIGTNNPYSGVHQFGGGNNIPPRPYFPITRNGTSYQLTPYAQRRVENAAMTVINQLSK